MRRSDSSNVSRTIRCAIYTRKSTDEGLDLDYNSLDAQRDSAEAYIASQAGEGWLCIPDRYDDGGFTGGNMERPALKRLMADIEAGRVDCVVVYKVDRLSRSLMDFARMMETFEKKGVSFVSVTQHFNTTHSMGRLTLNILLSFAQFEREIISERTRDKIAAARRKGKWAGGHPVLGYDLHSGPGGTRLTVNRQEAKRVKRIFELYLERQTIGQTIAELDRLGWRTKQWTTKNGHDRGGQPFAKSSLYKLLTNVAYLGMVKYKDQTFDGEHDAIVDDDLFRRVQTLLRRNGRTSGSHVRNKHGALLKGLVRCKACGCGMGHHYASSGPKRYRYYVCHRALKKGWSNCPSPSLPAGELEAFVVGQIREVGQDGDVLFKAVAKAQASLRDEHEQNKRDRSSLQKRIDSLRSEITRLENADRTNHVVVKRDELDQARADFKTLEGTIEDAESRLLDEDEMVGALESFDPVWESLCPKEQARLIRLVVRQIEWDHATQSISIAFHDDPSPCLQPGEMA